MRLVRLVTQGFRNLAPVDLSTDARFVVVHGPNAQGKTNLLEAVWMLSTLRPLRGHRVRDLVRWGEDDAAISGWVSGDDGTHQLRVDLGGPRRTVQVDGSPVRELDAYFDWIRAIAFQPADATIITEGPALRRAWLDRAAFTAHPAHLGRVRVFQRTLAQKAATLRGDRPDRDLLDVLDAQLAHAGAVLVDHRVRMLRELAPHIRDLHRAIAGIEVEVGIRYRTACDGADVAAREAKLVERLAASRAEEVRRHRCLVGPQKDEVSFSLEGHAARHFGSRGQVRSLVLAMKLAELVAARARGDRPLFLLDDLSSELDRARTDRLVERLVDLGAQVWVTTTDPEHLGALPREEVQRIGMAGGQAALGD